MYKVDLIEQACLRGSFLQALNLFSVNGALSYLAHSILGMKFVVYVSAPRVHKVYSTLSYVL